MHICSKVGDKMRENAAGEIVGFSVLRNVNARNFPALLDKYGKGAHEMKRNHCHRLIETESGESRVKTLREMNTSEC